MYLNLINSRGTGGRVKHYMPAQNSVKYQVKRYNSQQNDKQRFKTSKYLTMPPFYYCKQGQDKNKQGLRGLLGFRSMGCHLISLLLSLMSDPRHRQVFAKKTSACNLFWERRSSRMKLSKVFLVCWEFACFVRRTQSYLPFLHSLCTPAVVSSAHQGS